ncbi:MAG: sialidase family protein, partial [Candidatus Thermoplasmatota archaeon]
HTWRTNYVGGPAAERNPGSPLYGYECITDPILTFNRDGDLFYNLQAYQQEAEGVVPGGLPMGADVAMMALAVSHDGGETWPEIIPEFFGDDLTVFPDYMRMGTNPQTGSVFAQWNTIVGLASSQPTLVSYRPGTPLPVTQPWFFVTPEQPTGLGESSIVGGNDGTVYSLLGGFNSPGVAYMAKSTDDGMTFSVPTLQFEFTAMDDLEDVEFRTGTAVEMAIDTSGGDGDGCLYAAWADGSQDDQADILGRSSCDGGASWTEPVLVSSGPHGDAQFFPRVSVDGRGAIHVVYLTRAYDPAHHLVDAEWALSEDGGATWTTTRLTRHSFDGDLGVHQNGFPFLGDYIGIGSSGDHTYMAFPSTLTGRAEIAVAHVVAPAAAAN